MRYLMLTISITGVVVHLILLLILNLGTDLVIDKTSDFIQYEMNEHLSKEIAKIKSNKMFKAVKSLFSNHIENIDFKVDSFENMLKNEIFLLTKELKSAKGKVKITQIESFEITKFLNDRDYMRDWLRFKYMKHP